MAAENKNNVIAKQTVIANGVKQSANKKEIASAKKLRNDVRVPKLRFNEFVDGWSFDKMDNITSYVDYRGRAPEKSNEGVFLVTAKNIKKGYIDYDKSKEYVPLENYNLVMSKGLPELGDILFTTEAPLGNIAQVDKQKIALAQRVIKLRGKDKIENLYLLHYMLSPIYQKLIHRKAIGTTVQGISGKELRKTKVAFPTLPEQQKIASFLTSVDTKIQQLTTKKQLLENYKKGVMQQLFSQQLRFKNDDGLDFPDWEEKKFGEVFNNIGGTALEKHFSKSGTHKVVSIGNYSTEGKYNENGQRIILNEKTKTKLLDKGDLVMVLNDKTSTGDIIGSTILIPENNLYIYNQRSERLICIRSIIYPIYAWFQLNYKEFRNTVFSVSQGGTQIYVNFSEVKKLNIKIPSLKEQQKIANYLSAIDIKIENVQTQIEKTQAFKKGLLQQMFV
ncbi:restriction endonuclease subunit S [Polaribacter haliotis]|uniref:Restriction endonuclease subunit S n=1 Tax=Polaribacter haliotis TaxID=1888915 RepID=A0A7L8AH74_9FLAO|nr:restriction endonuclease subunit S [Polaribacter haliotis]QOD61352.1 restriction endonuclease subunit S [Polaribacter haliotis]